MPQRAHFILPVSNHATWQMRVHSAQHVIRTIPQLDRAASAGYAGIIVACRNSGREIGVDQSQRHEFA